MKLTDGQKKALKQIAANLSDDGFCLDSSGIRHTTACILRDNGLVKLEGGMYNHRVRAGRSFGCDYKTVSYYSWACRITDLGRKVAAEMAS